MNELRKDYLLDRWVIIAKERAKRPKDFVVEERKIHRGICPFCPHSIDMPLLLTLPEKGPWKVAVIPNKYPAVALNFPSKLEADGLKYHAGASGFHEIVIESPHHDKDLWELPEEHIALYLKALQLRQAIHMANKAIVYTAIFKNRGVAAGESISHAHTQILSTTKVPEKIATELEAFERKKATESCIFEKIIQEETASERFLFESRRFVAIAPYASVFPGEMWIIAKEHFRDLLELDEKTLGDLAKALKKALTGLNRLFPGVSYNFAFHQAPKGKDFHFHVEIYPRISKHAGLEVGFGLYINVLPPEEFAAAFKEVMKP